MPEIDRREIDLCELYTLLSVQPTTEAWRRFCARMQQVAAQASPQALVWAIAACQGPLVEWPDALRIAPAQWLSPIYDFGRGPEVDHDHRMALLPLARTLDFQNQRGLTRESHFDRLCGSPLAANITTLILGGTLADGEVDALLLQLAGSAYFSALTALHVEFDFAVRLGTAHALARSETLAGLETLEISGDWERPQVQALAHGGALAKLRRLSIPRYIDDEGPDLRGASWQLDHLTFSPTSRSVDLTSMFAAPALAALRTLHFDPTHGGGGAAVLGAALQHCAGSLEDLKFLVADYPDTVATLVAFDLPRLRTLDIDDGGDRAAPEKLSAWPDLARLRKLRIRSMGGRPRAWVTCPFSRLEELHLVGMKGLDVKALVDSPYVGSLRTLTIESSSFGKTGCAALGSVGQLRGLKNLTLIDCNPHASSLAEFARSPLIAQLDEVAVLCWSRRRTVAPFVEGLATREDALPLRALEVRSIGVQQHHVIDAFTSGVLANLRRISLPASTRLGDDVVAAIAESGCAENLEQIDLSRCAVTSLGAKVFADAERFPRLQVLNLDHNSLSFESICGLSATLPELRKLHVAGKGLRVESEEEQLSPGPRRRLELIDMRGSNALTRKDARRWDNSDLSGVYRYM